VPIGFFEMKAVSLSAYAFGGYIAADRNVSAVVKIGQGFLVWTFTVEASTISTRSIGSSEELPRSLLAGFETRSRLNFTESALNSSPLWNFTPLRSLTSQVLGAISLGISAARAGTILKLRSRSYRVSNIWAPTLEAGVSAWFIMSSELGSTPWAMTTLPSGAAPARPGPPTRNRNAVNRRIRLM
jgi:hypothetical protein